MHPNINTPVGTKVKCVKGINGLLIEDEIYKILAVNDTQPILLAKVTSLPDYWFYIYRFELVDPTLQEIIDSI